jgi:hypothetical protein
MVKANLFDGFEFSFIQIAHILKKICPRRCWLTLGGCARRLAFHGFPADAIK